MPSGLSSPRWCQDPAKPPWKASIEVTSGVRNCLDHFCPLAWDFVIIYLAWLGAIQDFGWSLGDYFHDPKIWRDLVYYHINSVQVLFMTFYDCHESQVHYSNYLPNGQVPDDPISIPRSNVKTPRSEGQRRNPRYCWWVSHQLLRYQLDFAPESTVTVKVEGKSSTVDIGCCGPSIEYTVYMHKIQEFVNTDPPTCHQRWGMWYLNSPHLRQHQSLKQSISDGLKRKEPNGTQRPSTS